jgi:hypothetical protein
LTSTTIGERGDSPRQRFNYCVVVGGSATGTAKWTDGLHTGKHRKSNNNISGSLLIALEDIEVIDVVSLLN